MIVAISTSSSLASVAFLSRDGAVIDEASRAAPRSASGTALALLEELQTRTHRQLAEAELFVADIGPGSFTGTRVGVTLAKVLAYRFGRPCAGIASFDLISPLGPAAIPARKGHWFLRLPGEAAQIVDKLPEGTQAGAQGVDEDHLPLASRCASCLHLLREISAFELLPAYLAEPNISIPKKPYAPPYGGTPGA